MTKDSVDFNKAYSIYTSDDLGSDDEFQAPPKVSIKGCS